MKALALIGLAACGLGSDSGLPDSGGGGDANNCGIELIFDPASPVAGDHVKVTAQAFTTGVLDYAWTVDGQPTAMYEAADHSAIGFDAPSAVSHTVAVTISPANGCTAKQVTVNVGTTGEVVLYRMRVIPPTELAPPQEAVIQVHGGQLSVDRPFVIDPGALVTGTVVSGATPIPAYVRWQPLVGPAFDLVTSTGAFTTHAQLQMHAVIVIPQSNALAPRAIPWMPGGSATFSMTAGTAVTGTVLDRSGSPLANAQVQLAQLGVPSTIGTTAANGTYAVRTAFVANQPIIATITPPATSGLPKLTATAQLDLAQPVNASFAASPAPCDLAGTAVKRGGANQAGAAVTIVGALAAPAGAITNGAVSTPASGTVHVAAVASAGGTLPATLVPRAPLAAVIQLAAQGDLAVSAFDASACAAQLFDAPARIAAAGEIHDPADAQLAGARVEAVPTGALAMANLIPVQATSDAHGAFTLQLAAGGHYALHFSDPGGRGSPRDFPDVLASVPATTVLAKAIAITGTVTVQDHAGSIANASVQLLCASCTGLAASMPIAQTATDLLGAYRVAVPDPN